MKPLLVLRPEPGNRTTFERARAMGLEPLACPLFAIEPVVWTAPEPAAFDYLLLTSVNALRHGGQPLARLTALPVLAVGDTTAAAARAAGFTVAATGNQGVDALLATVPPTKRLLHLAGADHRPPATGHAIDTVIVYRAAELPAPRIPSGLLVALVHSARAGQRLAQLAPDHAAIAIAAISPAAAAACGPGWASVAAADRPAERALLALAARLCQG